jgi:basic membrane protein A and related proteins
MNTKSKRGLALVALVGAFALIGAACGGKTTPSQKPTTVPVRLIVGALHVGSITDAGYNQAQHDGLVYMEKHVPGIKLIEAENVPEGPDAERVMENMIAQGAKLIFPQSFGYMDYALNVAKRHPNVIFEHPAGYKLAPNFGTYWAASDQLNYALGVAAGLMTKSDKIGFIGAMPIPQVIASINAYHLGARSVNPTVTTTALFTGSWSDPAKEAASTNTMADRGVDVVASLVDSPVTIVQTAEARGLYSIGYHSAAVAKFAPKGWISGVDFNWGPMFVQFANQVLNGTWKSENLVPGLGSDIVRLAPFGKAVPLIAENKATETTQSFLSGLIKSPYVGPVYDQSGKLRIAAGAVPGADFLNGVNWFAEGIIGQTK